MPGISFVCNFDCNTRIEKAKSLAISDRLFNQKYYKSVHLENQFYYLQSEAYENYPVKKYESEKYLIILEGKIYWNDEAKLKNELFALAESLSNNSLQKLDKVKKWISNTDGEFVILIFNKHDQSFYILNDLLGRLPLYHYQSGNTIIISRDIRFISKYPDTINFDQLSLAQYLLFGYPLGKRSLFEKIYYANPATLIQFNPLDSKVTFSTLNYFDFSETSDINDLDKAVEEISESFLTGCLNRASMSGNNILSLSGGLDSRAIATGLHNTEVPYIAATFLDAQNAANKDFIAAKKIADKLNVPWEGYKLSKTDPKFQQQLLYLKCGHNNLQMSFLLDFFEQLIDKHGSNITYLTGDGGDKALPLLVPTKKIQTIEELADYILYKHSLFSINDVANMTRLDANKIRSSIKERLADYPENDFNKMYKAFIIRERATKWLFEGEDRNRCFFWSTTPFYSLDFFNKAIQIPDQLKSNFKLYRKFLTHLSPEIIKIENPDWDAPINSVKSLLHTSVANLLTRAPVKLQQIIQLLRRINYNQPINTNNPIKQLQESFENGKSVSKFLALHDTKVPLSQLNSIQWGTIHTLTEVISDFDAR